MIDNSNNYGFINNLIGSALYVANSEHLSREDRSVILIQLESIIDQARSAVPPGSGLEFPEEKSEMEKNLNELRKVISELINQSDKKLILVKLESSHQMTESEWGLKS